MNEIIYRLENWWSGLNLITPAGAIVLVVMFGSLLLVGYIKLKIAERHK